MAGGAGGEGASHASSWWLVAAFWLLVTLPLAWGVWETLRQTAALFG